MKVLYKEGDILEEDQYLLKVIPKDITNNSYLSYMNTYDRGYLTKFNKNNTIPVNFSEWRYYDYSHRVHIYPDIYVFDEYFRKGWKFIGVRDGTSRNWAVLLHPENFTLEVYLHDFVSLCQTETIINGEIQGEFLWKNNKLIKKGTI